MDRQDHYRTLGVSADAEEVVIRAAYLALMRRYHPDRSPEDARRAQEINAAFEVLGSPERRADYDRSRRKPVWLEAPEVVVPPVRRVPNRLPQVAAFLVLLIASGFLAVQMLNGTRQTAAPAPKIAPEPGFSSAAAGEPALRPEPPVLAEEELPPLPELPEAETTLDEEVPPLPTLVRTAPLPAVRPFLAERPRARPAPSSSGVTVASNAPKSALAELDRHLMLLTNQSMQAADARRRALLASTGTAFAARLSACATDACKRDAYLARNQEVAAIMGS